jgi:hypothetical protein
MIISKVRVGGCSSKQALVILDGLLSSVERLIALTVGVISVELDPLAEVARSCSDPMPHQQTIVLIPQD